MGDKYLTEKGWNDVAPKELKDKSLHKALKEYNYVDEDNYPDQIRALGMIIKAAGELKKAPPCKTPELLKYLSEVIKSAEAAKKKAEDAQKKAEKEAKDKADLAKLEAKHKAEDVEAAYSEGYADGNTRLRHRGPEYAKDRDLLKSYNDGYKKGASEESDLPPMKL